ncbi:hypothetical protein [Aestuariimicrobium kwangyangense]|uniref:hypothetical protein n=1 Tax=Aestuariimicrobium kwangyangense TaxID=396389 RepID=UPI0003B442E7|nr:hypothetical protein [Aestuariimicrobium kwangyangense]
MKDVAAWGNHVSAMVFGALRVWWTLLPQLLAVNALGYLGLEAALVVAPSISSQHAWLAVVVLAFGLVLQLSAVIVSLRLIGRALNVSALLPDDAVTDDRDTSAAHLLAITLLPFLGIYSVFGRVQDVVNSLIANEVVIRGLGERSVMSTLSPRTAHQLMVVSIVVVVAYVVRRGVDLLHEKTDFRPLGLLAAMIEAFFMLVFLLSGTSLLLRLWSWLGDRVFAAWWRTVAEGWRTSAAEVSHLLPRVVSWLWHQLVDLLWPLFKSGLAEPLLWLAVAALVYGSHVLSLAEVWRQGEPLSAHLDREHRIDLRRRAKREHVQGSNLARRTWLEVQEAFFGDVDDKYLPTFQSLRLVLGTGLPFLGAYVLCYALFNSVEESLLRLVLGWIGTRDSVFWVAWLSLINLFTSVVGDSLKYALLGVAFVRTLQAFRTRADPSALSGDPEVGVPVEQEQRPVAAGSVGAPAAVGGRS